MHNAVTGWAAACLLAISTTSAAQNPCSDFAGSWVGECQDASEEPYADSVRIDQIGCNYFRIARQEQGEERYEVGEVKRTSRTSATTGWTSEFNEIALWNQDSSILMLSSSSFSYNMRDNEHWKDRTMQRIAIRTGKLIFVSELNGEGLVQGVTKTRASQLICRYNKQ